MAMISLQRQQHVILQVIISGLIIVNWLFLHWPIFGISLGILYLSLNSKKIADLLFPKIVTSFKNVLGLLTILSYVSLSYTVFYHIYQINELSFLFSLISIPLIVELISWRKNCQHYFLADLDLTKINVANIKNIVLPFLFLVTESLIFVLLFRRSSENVIRSPWELLDAKFWFLFIVLSVILLVYLIKNKHHNRSLFFLSLYFFLISSLALVLYQLGFGYDQYLHQAALEIIKQTGTLEPKSFLYLGQYAWTLWLQNIWQLDLKITNSLLMPLAFSIFWPHSLYYGLRHGFKWSSRQSMISIPLSLFIGFNFAIMTTPQNLAFLLTAIFIFLLPVIKKNPYSLALSLIFGLSVTSIHPLGGSAIVYFSLLYLSQTLAIKQIFKNILFVLLFLLAAISLPSLLILYQKLAGIPWSEIINGHFWPLIQIPNFVFYHDYHFPLDLLHNIGQNRIWIFIFVTVLAWYLIIKKHKYLFFESHLILFILLALNYLLAKIFVSFGQQIDYEQNAYLVRILYLLALTALPIFLTGWYFWWEKYLSDKKLNLAKLWLIIVSLVIISTSLYFSYPVYDRHQNSKSFNVTKDDLDSVHLINQAADNEAYIVLANQMLGAAAIDTFGFKAYYNNNFYYSMPLGTDNIYQNFLNMIEKQASREESLLAMDKAGVDKLYFIVNDYWHSAKSAINQAKLSADHYFVVGKNHIFVYQR
ncbi:hypothetical protein KBC40_03705 [Patescibacteria group bacterium]|nr:hypothetical protein [Patescibacteria group bacterium]